MLEMLAEAVPMLSFFASMFLIAAIVHVEAIPGVRQDWLVRPIRRGNLLLEKFRPFLERLLDGVFEGARFGRLRWSGLVGRNDLDINEIRRQRIRADGIFENLLILHFDRLRNDKVLLVRSELSFRAGHIQRRQRADLQLLPIVPVQSLRHRDGLLLHLDVSACEH